MLRVGPKNSQNIFVNKILTVCADLFIFIYSRLIHCQISLFTRLWQKWTEQGQWAPPCVCEVCSADVMFSSAFCEPQNNILHYPNPTTHITHNLKTRVGHSTELTSFLGSVCLLLALHYINTSPAVSVSLQPADYFQCDSGNPAKWQIKGQLLEANSFMI